jgi:hypothetical protein
MDLVRAVRVHEGLCRGGGVDALAELGTRCVALKRGASEPGSGVRIHPAVVTQARQAQPASAAAAALNPLQQGTLAERTPQDTVSVPEQSSEAAAARIDEEDAEGSGHTSRMGLASLNAAVAAAQEAVASFASAREAVDHDSEADMTS